MNLHDHYEAMWKQSVRGFEKGAFDCDPHIDDDSDTRYGLSLVIRPTAALRQHIGAMLDDLRSAAPQQYLYPASDLHVTVLSVISCQPGFSTRRINVASYRQLLAPVLRDCPPFELRFNGITASPAGVMLQGYPRDDTLQNVRARLRSCLEKSGLPHSFIRRYRRQTAHMTLLRFKHPPRHPEPLLQMLRSHRSTTFGSMMVNTLRLVANDWYHRRQKVQLLDSFDLRG